VVDGIDECSKHGQKGLLDELQSLCFSSNLRTKVLLSSRKEPNIKVELSNKPRISLDENEKVELDIQHYVSQKIQEIQANFGRYLQQDVFNRIASLVADKADGIHSYPGVISHLTRP
jgi:hypothetical protein